MAFCRAMLPMTVTFVVVALWSSTTAVIIRDDMASQWSQEASAPHERHHGAWAACEPAVCHQVQTQAEGLDKIKILRNFVRETLSLLDQLVTTLDTEIVETGSALRQFIGPRCPTSHALLDQVSKTDVAADRFNTNEHTGEVRGDLEVDISSTRHLQNQEVSHQGQQHQKQENMNSHQEEEYHQENEKYEQYHEGHEHLTEQGSVGQSKSASSSSSSIKHQKNSHTSSSGGKSLKVNETQASTKYGSSSSHTTAGGTSGDTVSKSSMVEGKGGSQIGCRGLRKGESPYWVPGLDEWCAVNCAQGYCPETHCICDTH